MKALLFHLRKQGLQAYTLPTLAMFPQLRWMVEGTDLHPACLPLCSERLTTDNLQAAYDALIAQWRPDEIVLVDGQVDRLGFDPRGVPVFTVDHHTDRGIRDDSTAYIQPAPATACLLVDRFKIYEPILVVGILTDTYWLRRNMPAAAIETLSTLHRHGLTDEILMHYQRQLMVQKDPRALDALRHAIFHYDGDAVFIVLREADADIHRATVAEVGYFFRHMCVVRGDGYVSFRTTDTGKDLCPLAQKFGGGGHPNMSAAHLTSMSDLTLEHLRDSYFRTIKGS